MTTFKPSQSRLTFYATFFEFAKIKSNVIFVYKNKHF